MAAPSREQLAPLINLASDIPGVAVHQRWMSLEPRRWWQKPLWGIHRAWRFEVEVLAMPVWTYRVCATLEEARLAAFEANREHGTQLDTRMVTRENVEEVTGRMHRFLKGWYFTVIEKSPLCGLSDGRVSQRTAVFVREEPNRLVAGSADEWGVYGGE